MARVILKKEPRQVSGRWIKPGELCTIPDSLAKTLETRGLCEVVDLKNRAGLEVDAKASEAAARKKAAEKLKTKKATKKKGKSDA